jgi:eukaryotic-like serine/threonine-protein kinase
VGTRDLQTLDHLQQTQDADGPSSVSRPPVARVQLPPRYVDLGCIGVGGFGEVRRVRDERLGCVLAMKILRLDAQDQPDVRRRFLSEARLTAQLQHPGIVAVQDLGELPDGRSWYTMEEVRGRTFSSVVAELHRTAQDPSATWTLRRVVGALASACQAVAAAHAEGVIHRDLKPDNVMVGAFGEVRVMDWGLARLEGASTPDHAETPIGLPSSLLANQTAAGRVMGTPAYMAPEQARGERIRAVADVYALGAMLYQVLAGRPPYLGDGRTAWLGVLAGPPPDVQGVAPWPLPDELVDICQRAMARAPDARFKDAASLADALAAWLEGARKRQEAMALVDAVRQRLPEAAALRGQAQDLARQAAQALDGVAPNAPFDDKLAGWRLEAQALAALVDARAVEAELVRDLRAALTGAPDLGAAHDTLADLYRARLEDAELRGDLAAVAEHELNLRTHDRGRHRAWLAGEGAISLVTDPPGARVDVWRCEERDRRLVDVRVGSLGETPLREVALPRGSYVLVVSRAGCAPVRCPIQLGRLEHWDGVRPGGAASLPIWLPPAGSLGPDDCYVPAGWFKSGGDPNALDGLPARRLWVDGLLVRRHPVTNAEYLAFMNDVRDDHWCPRDPVQDRLLYVRGPTGDYQLPVAPGGDQVPCRPDEPVSHIDVASARAYAAWEAARTGVPWRLPHDQEWEKAARGVDGRLYPWGNHLDPSWACMQLSHVGVPNRAPVAAYPADCSPYGVRGLGGNVRDWCSNDYQRTGLAPAVLIVPRDEPDPDASYCMVRGGSIVSAATGCLAAGRMAWNPASRGAVVGFRLVADVAR